MIVWIFQIHQQWTPKRNLLLLDDCFLGTQNKAEAYYTRGAMSCLTDTRTEENYKDHLKNVLPTEDPSDICPFGQKKLDSSFFMGKRKLHTYWMNPDPDDDKTDFEHTNVVQDERDESCAISDHQENDNIPLKKSRFNNEENIERCDSYIITEKVTRLAWQIHVRIPYMLSMI